MEIRDLIGEHEISGIDRETFRKDGEDCELCRVVLDGKIYEFRENPDDGYRSYHEGPDLVETEVHNRFPGILIDCEHRTKGAYGDEDDVLVFKNKVTGEAFLSVGTEAIDDYYPGWVCDFSAEALGQRNE